MWGVLYAFSPSFFQESKDSNDEGVHLFEPHARPVNCLRFAPANPGKIYSTAYDGTVRCGDFEKGVFDEVS